GQQVEGVVQGGLETAQIAIVDAQQRGLKFQRDFQLGAVVDFHQHVHAQFDGQGFELLQLRRAQRSGDEQDAIGAQGSGGNNLVGVDNEVLAQHRQRAGGTRLTQVVVAALEILDV